MKNILISGTKGHVGNCLAQFFSKESNVWTFDRGSLRPIILSRQKYATVGGCFDLVIHAAGVSPYMNPSTTQYIEGNVFFTKKFIDSIEKYDVKKFIYLSAVSVYEQTTGSCLSENSKIQLGSWYGLSKYLAENLILDHFGDKAIILRLPGVIGSEHIWLAKAIHSTYNQVKFDIYNKKDFFNNCISPADIFNFCNFIMARPSVQGLFNMAAMDPIRLEKVVSIIAEKFGVSATYREVEIKKSSAQINISLLNSTGFRSRTTTDIIVEACENFLSVRR